MKPYCAGYGLNAQESEYESFGKDIVSLQGFWGDRFAEGKVGILLTASYFDTDRGSIFNSRRWDNLETQLMNRRRITDYDVHRLRYGSVLSFDYQPSQNSKWTLTGNYNRYKDDEVRRQARYTWSNNREKRRTRNRLEDQKVFFAKLKGEHTLGNISLDYLGAVGLGSEDLPDRTEWRYRREVETLSTLSVAELNNLSANSTFGDTDPLEFKRVEFKPRFTKENNLTFAANISIPTNATKNSVFKLGAKLRKLSREYRDAGFRAKSLDGAAIPTFQEGQFPFSKLKFTDAEFAKLPFDSNNATIDLDNALEGYDASEQVIAAYAMNTTKWTEKLTSVAGLRLENTTTDYAATSDGMKGEGSYTNLLPSVNFTYRIDNNNQLRAAFYSAIARPNYTSLVPYESIGDEEIKRGNEYLEPLTALNYDIMYERYMNNLSSFTFGLFAKNIKNQIVTEQVDAEGGLPVFSPVNAGKASVYRFEVAYNQNLKKVIGIPLSLNLNYTFTESEADFGDDRDELPLANSPKHTANFALLYDDPKSGFSGVIGGVYRHYMFNKFENTDKAVDGNEEIWLGATFHLDFSLAYKITEKITAKLQVNNLTNQANEEITRKPSEKTARWSETEGYGAWGVLGVEIKF